MKLFDLRQVGVAMVAGILVTVLSLPIARGELVYDEKAAGEERTAVDDGMDSQVAQTSDRESMRQVLGSAQKAQVTRAVEAMRPVAPETQPVVATVAIASDLPATEVETQHLSRTELMRRERMREEMKNEDILQVRLEELRLRDEKHRTQKLLVGEALAMNESKSAQNSTIFSAPVQEEVVIAPVTDRGAQSQIQSAAPSAVAIASSAPTLDSSTLQGQMTQGQMTMSLDDVSGDENATVSLTPRFGLSDMSDNSYFSVRSRYSIGVGLDFGVSDNVTLELGYMFSEYGVAMTSSNPVVDFFQRNYNYNFNPSNGETQAMKQNLVDAGLKLYLLRSSSKLRPFVGGGAAYSRSYINYDSRILDYLYQARLNDMARDYEVSSFLGYLSSGFDVRLSKGVSIGAMFKYYRMLTSRENQSLNTFAFTGYPGYYPGPVSMVPPLLNPADYDKSSVGGTLARSSFYSILANVSFTF